MVKDLNVHCLAIYVKNYLNELFLEGWLYSHTLVISSLNVIF